MGFEQIVDPTSPLHDIQSSYVKNLVSSMRALALNHLNRMIATTWSMESYLTGKSTGDAIGELGGQKVGKEKSSCAAILVWWSLFFSYLSIAQNSIFGSNLSPAFTFSVRGDLYRLFK